MHFKAVIVYIFYRLFISVSVVLMLLLIKFYQIGIRIAINIYLYYKKKEVLCNHTTLHLYYLLLINCAISEITFISTFSGI